MTWLRYTCIELEHCQRTLPNTKPYLLLRFISIFLIVCNWIRTNWTDDCFQRSCVLCMCSTHHVCIIFYKHKHNYFCTTLRIRIHNQNILRIHSHCITSGCADVRVCMSYMAVFLSLVSFETQQVTDVFTNRSTRI